MKFKKGDHVVRKDNYDFIRTVKNNNIELPDCFEGTYISLEEHEGTFNENDFMLFNSMEESLRYALTGIVVFFLACLLVVLVAEFGTLLFDFFKW